MKKLMIQQRSMRSDPFQGDISGRGRLSSDGQWGYRTDGTDGTRALQPLVGISSGERTDGTDGTRALQPLVGISSGERTDGTDGTRALQPLVGISSGERTS